MITAHSGRATDFTGLGLGTLQPIQSEIREEAGGEYELELTQPVTEAMLHAPLMKHNIIKAPAPVREVPLSALVTPGTVTVTREIYRVITIKRLSLRSEPNDTTSYNIKCYDPGTLVAKISDEGQQGNHKWYRVQILDGGQVGYMAWQAQYDGVWYDYLTLDHTETETIQGDAPGTVVTPKQDREQLFRIYNVRRSSAEKTVTARAQHIFYDLKGVIVDGEFKPDGMAANQAVARILQMADREHPFHIYCQCTGEITADYSGRNLADCLLNPDDGILKQTGGRLLRDNFDVYILEDEVRMPGLELRRGCNLLQATLEEDAADIVTRIIPVGEDADGNPLRGDAVDSEHIDDYPIVYTKEIKYPVRVRENQNGGEGGTSSGDYPTEAEALEALQEKAEEDFASGIDLPTVSIDAEYVRRELAPEFADAANQLALHMYDAAPVIDPETGLQAALRMTSYTWDCLMKRYTETGLGEIQSLTPTVYGYQIGGSISGTKLLAGTVGGGALRDAAIGYAKIGTAAITQLAADAVTAVRAVVRALVAGQITTDQLYADLAEIAVAQITTAHIQTANIQWANITELTSRIAAVAVAQITTANIQAADIQWANISELTSRIATVAAAQITTANIQTANIQWANISELNAQIASIASSQIANADIDYAKIKDLTAGTAIITEGVGGQLYIARLAVTDANMVTLTAGELLLKAANGSFVRLIADGQGGVTTQTVQVEGSNIAEATITGGKLIENTITARELNVSTIFADQALIGAIKAANIDVADLFAAQATINQLNALDIRGNEYLRLLVSDSIGDISVGGRNLMANTAAYPKGNNADKAELTGDTYQGCAVRYYENTASSGETIYIRRAHTLAKSSRYVLSMWVKGTGTISINTQEANPVEFTASNGATAAGHAGVSFTLSDKWARIWVQVRTRAWSAAETASKTFTVKITAGSAAYSAGWKLEAGNMATDWSPAPEDTESAIAANAAEIALTNQQVALRATQADLNTMGDRVTAAEGALTVQAGQIAARVTKTEFGERAIDGRNLLLDSGTEQTVQNTYKVYALSGYGQDRFAGGQMTVTLSFDAKATEATDVDHYPRTASGAVTTWAQATTVGTEWARYSRTYVFQAAGYVAFTIRSNNLVTGGGGSTTATVYLRNVKLETGALATDWSPAPEDTQGDISDLAARMGTAESSITQQAGQIALKADQTTVDGLGQRLGAAEGTITAQADEIAARVTKTEFDSLAVGGRNLLTNTAAYPKGNSADKAELNGTTYQGCAVRYYDYTAGSTGGILTYIRRAATLAKSSQYVLSMWVKGSGTVNIRTQEANPVDFTASSGETAAGNVGVSFTLSDKWERIWVRIRTRAWNTADTASKTFTVRITAGSAAYSAGWKLEAGTMATDWSPAPEDTEGEISALGTRMTTAEAKITDSAIVSTVRSSSAYQSDLTTVEQTANAYTISVAGGVQVGGTNMFPNTKPMKLGNYTIDASGASAQGTVTEVDGGFRIVNSGSNVQIWFGNRFPMIGGQSYAVSFRYKVNSGTLDAPDILFRCRDASDNFTYKSSADGAVTVTDMESGWKKFAVVFAPPAGTVSVDVAFRTGADYALYTNNFFIREFKLETGTRATAWSPAPEDAVTSLDTGPSGVKVKISSSDFSVDVPGTGGDLCLDSSGGHLQKAIIGELDCPNAAKVYTGTASITVGKSTSTFLSLAEAFAALNGSVIKKTISVTLEADLYESVDLAGVCGAAGSGITINGGGYTLYGRMTIRYMQPRVVLDTFKLVGDTASSYPLLINGCPFVYLTDCTIDASGCTGAETQAVYTYASTLRMDRVAMYNATHLLNCEYLSHVLTYNLKGGNCTNFLRALASVVHMVGTRPGGSYSGGWGMMIKPDDPTTLTADSGSAQPVVVPTTTSTLSCTASGHYWNGWESGNSMLQGSYDNATYAGCMWFDTAAISGKTVRSAALTLRRLSGYGTWDTSKLYLCGTTLTGKSGNPITGCVSYGSIGSLAEGASGTFAVPAAAVQALASGTVKGLMLYVSGDTHNRGNIYSDNFSAYAGYGATGAPSLSVTYDT